MYSVCTDNNVLVINKAVNMCLFWCRGMRAWGYLCGHRKGYENCAGEFAPDTSYSYRRNHLGPCLSAVYEWNVWFYISTSCPVFPSINCLFPFGKCSTHPIVWWLYKSVQKCNNAGGTEQQLEAYSQKKSRNKKLFLESENYSTP